MGDLVAASALHADMMAAIHACAFAPMEAWNAAAITTLLAQPGVFGLVDPRGGMVLVRCVADESEVLTLAVRRSARGGGIGFGLLADVEQRAAVLGAASMFLEVSDRNFSARRLYDRCGFEAVGQRREYYPDGASALVMRKTLVYVS